MSAERPSRSIEELLHANPDILIKRDRGGTLIASDVTDVGIVDMTIVMEDFQFSGNHSLLIAARDRLSTRSGPFRNDRSYLRISSVGEIVLAEHLYPLLMILLQYLSK